MKLKNKINQQINFLYKNRYLDLKKPEKTWKKQGQIAKSAEKPRDSY